ncbi:MAG: sulfatase-like hydrolase/transferase, partial [Gemmatimonadetes bacterium]|nr:sulfatase-like hydrolase/transferase [Gemmatimonadota bacterium]
MSRPNVIYILADDMGFGDMGCNNPASRIPTPHLDRLASQGMRFTNAHAPTSVCTPSRYAVLTGRYCWRSRLKSGIVWQWDAPLLETERPTVAD